MTIQLRPEDEQVVRERLAKGDFSSPEEVIHHALRCLNDHDTWLLENRDAIHSDIETGLAELDRGEGLSSQRFREFMDRGKTGWQAKQSQE